MKGRTGTNGGERALDDESDDVVINVDPIEAAQLEAEAKSRGVPVSQVLSEKFNHGLERTFPFFSGPVRPPKTRH